MPTKGVGQTFFNWSFATVLFMMNKSMDQKPEINIVIRFYFYKLQTRNWQPALIIT